MEFQFLNFIRRRVAKVAADTMVGGATRQVLLGLQLGYAQELHLLS
jgi:hypothetical protein